MSLAQETMDSKAMHIETSGTPPTASAHARPDALLSDRPSSEGFLALLSAYRSTGGLARGGDLARLLEDHCRGDYVSLARLIGAGHVFGFSWRGTLWIPMFQFDVEDLSIKPGTREVLAELGSAFDGWARAAWFANPSGWLNGRQPVELLNTDLARVRDAARADGLVAMG